MFFVPKEARKIRARLSIILLSAFVVWVGPVPAQTTTNSPLTTGQSAVTFKSDDLKAQVTEAIEQAKQNDLSFVSELMRRHKDRPDLVLNLLVPYQESEESNVKFAVVIAASQAKTPRSLAILTEMVDDSDVGLEAARVLYENNDCKTLKQKGGKRLEGALIRGFIRSRYSTHGTLLLSCFKGNRKIVDLLERRRKTYRVPQRSQALDELITLDLALANMGKADARARVVAYFAQRKIESILVVFRYLKAVEDRPILARVVETLRDKGRARQVGFPDAPPTYTRLSDEAMQALALRNQGENPALYGPPKRYSDADLNQTYQRLKKQWGLAPAPRKKT